MANVAGNVLVGKPLVTGGAWMAPLGTALPTDATSALPAAYTDLGYVGEGGLTQAIGADIQEIKAWGGDTVRKIQTSHDVTYQLRLIESKRANSLGVYYGKDNVTETDGDIAVRVNSAELEKSAYVFEMLDAGQRIRVALPDAQVTERGDIVYQDEDVIGYEVTITTYPDANGNKAYIYIASAA